MSHAEETAMTAAEIDSFLGRHEIGVLGLARADEPYAVPISYGYDADERTVYLRLVSTPDSEKRRFLDSRPRARLVVYDRAEAEPVYRSVVAAGALAKLSPGDLTIDHVEQYGDAKRPLFEVWSEPTADLDIRLYELEPDELSGRRVEVDR